MTTPHAASPARPFPIEHALLAALFLAVVLMLSLPGARAVSAGFGWMPLWLLALLAASLATALALRCLRRNDAAPVASSAARRRRMAVAVPGRRRVAARGMARTARLAAAR